MGLDAAWLGCGSHLMVPGKVKVFDAAELDAARAWIGEAE